MNASSVPWKIQLQDTVNLATQWPNILHVSLFVVILTFGLVTNIINTIIFSRLGIKTSSNLAFLALSTSALGWSIRFEETLRGLS
ncbi:hypothetical protein Bpfe_028680 [Biomphalaria pfeifferi]|uniref:Uncharacterized protein n=1 Tax=Biomphalaria pfeifferi TaxID=112525 RepID=A0AAD8EWP4_BIOPF|nr:hypothetical protein Bpfe_028680 [Biomphalaria pfeifferi]